jgi:hypothetical protein
MDDTLLGFLIYCAPTLIAMFRCHRDLETIAIMNLLFGWTVLCWFVALMCALEPVED